jgi:zinc/manganese transport system ATP-binding protein
MHEALIRLQNVSLGYDGRAVLEHVSFTIEYSEFLALLGPNGAGKTTLLRSMLGLMPVLAGRIDYGFDRFATPPGYVPQGEKLNPIFPLTVLDVVLMGTYGRLAPLRPVGRRQRQIAGLCLDQVGLTDLSWRSFWELSGGQKQRVLIARALAVEPVLLLLDEPTAGVDPDAAVSIMELIAQLNHDCGLTVVLVTHQLQLVHRLASSVVWVEDGRAAKAPAASMFASESTNLFRTLRGSE